MKRISLIATMTLFAIACSPISDEHKPNSDKNKTDETRDIPFENSSPPAETINLYYAGEGFTLASTWYGESSVKPWGNINRPHTFQIRISTSIPSMEQYTDFIYNDWVKSVKPLLNKMRNCHAESDWTDRSFEYLYDTMQSISLTADKTIRGRQAGEELIDLFYITSQELQFTYPDADMITTEWFMTIDEWIAKDLLIPVPFGLMPIESFNNSEFLSEINFTIKITLANSGPVLECTFKRCFELE